ncbi:hypothetical protein [Phaeobacter gallaeciensis]|uniref:hypothetical protein n=1 Tax=Phaeobacter gallaeciensis TaxID=60890 RepID=UPI00237FBCFE|nr:hypothetical protein [Phaeobacter gallaeciensis]MDE4189616.1 hypothetical protein [Phaeobacter gallaeciensis]MDE4198768.1 hypothetical protein [Phaeobacter gallaeciensis]MDE4202913.1 hypothetical protein [Phaeobacter gallaeciensis]MDE4207057.1 hypothetical protein [Phaeobacter gallaeciensis]MDE4215718.1 hypothetical protein [Phaeobacter gallaeciensis]
MSDLIERLKSSVVYTDGDDCQGSLLVQEVAEHFKLIEAENKRLRMLVELAFEEGFQRAASMTEYVHMALEKQPEAWRGSKASAALEGE